MKKVILLAMVSLTVFGCHTFNLPVEMYKSDSLRIEQLTKNIFIHTSYLDIPNYGKFPCNGMLFSHDGEIVIFDTPIDNTASAELLKWTVKELNGEIKAVVVNHFHNDCLGGLQYFHEKGIPSYANRLTVALAKSDGAEIPKNGFEHKLELNVGNKEVINTFFGEGHTRDNIISYIPSEKVVFGGCLIKELNAGKGNLADANTKEWANTVSKIKEVYPDLKWVIPGHGKPGGIELLDYTMTLFKPE